MQLLNTHVGGGRLCAAGTWVACERRVLTTVVLDVFDLTHHAEVAAIDGDVSVGSSCTADHENAAFAVGAVGDAECAWSTTAQHQADSHQQRPHDARRLSKRRPSCLATNSAPSRSRAASRSHAAADCPRSSAALSMSRFSSSVTRIRMFSVLDLAMRESVVRSGLQVKSSGGAV